MHLPPMVHGMMAGFVRTTVLCALISQYVVVGSANVKMPAKHVLHINKSSAYETTQKAKFAVDFPTPPDRMHFLLMTDTGKLCLRIMFQAIFKIRWRNEGKVTETDVNMSKRSLHGSGICGRDNSIMKISWNDAKYAVELNFRQSLSVNNSTNDNISTWGVNRIEFTFDTRGGYFPTGLNLDPPIRHVMTSNTGSFFQAPTNLSYGCLSTQFITLNEYNGDAKNTSTIVNVTLVIWDVKLEAFQDIPPSPNSNIAVAHCSLDVQKSFSDSSTGSIVIGSCIIVIVIAIIAAFFVVKYRSKLHYRAVE